MTPYPPTRAHPERTKENLRHPATGRLRVAIEGVAGKGNFGDDLIARALIEGIAADVLLLTDGDAPLLALKHEDMRNSTTLAPFERNAVLRDVAAVFFGGGSLLKDFNRHHGAVETWIRRLRNAMWLRKRAVFAFVGVDEIENPLSRILARGARYADLVVVRDAESQRRLAELGVSGNVVLSADPVIASSFGESGSRSRAPGTLTVGLNLREKELQSGSRDEIDQILPNVTAALEHLAKRRSLRVVTVPFRRGRQDDAAAMAAIAERLEAAGIAVERTPVPATMDDLAAVYGRLDCLIAMRYHALVVAANRGLPFLAVSYAPKTDGLLADLGLPDARIGTGGTPGEIASRLETSSAAEPGTPADIDPLVRRVRTGFSAINDRLADPAWVRPGRVDRAWRWLMLCLVFARFGFRRFLVRAATQRRVVFLKRPAARAARAVDLDLSYFRGGESSRVIQSPIRSSSSSTREER